MTSNELRALRSRAGLTQAETAGLLRMTESAYQNLEKRRGEIEPGRVEAIQRKLGAFADANARMGERELRLALGEAVLMLDDVQLEHLCAKVNRAVVVDATSRAVMAQIEGTLSEALVKTRSDLQDARAEISQIRSALRL